MERMSGEDDWIFDPSLAAMNRELRRELRDEAEEIETVVAESELRGRSFADVAREYRNRGEIVAVAMSHRSFVGQIVYAAGDFVTLKNETIEVDLNLADMAYLKKVDRSRSVGLPAEEGSGTFEMRMVERKSPYERVEVGFRAIQETVTGRITAVGQDHMVILDDQGDEWTAPMTALSYVIAKGRRALK